MSTVQTWLNRWVNEELSVPRSTPRFPDDVARQSGHESPNYETAGDFAPQAVSLVGFRRRTRRRREFQGLSLADLHALGGASEERFSGYLSIREDLPPGDYLAVPFVRRAWRLLWLLDDGGGVHFEFRRSSFAENPGAPPALRAISFDWRLARSLDMDPRTAQLNLCRLLQILLATEFLDGDDSHGLSSRAYELIRGGRVGAFYKALFLRLFNRYPWGLHDELPPLTFIQYNALFMTWLLTHTRERALTPAQLQPPLMALARQVSLESDGINWSKDAELVVRAVRERYLRRIGRMLGLCQEASDPFVPETQAYRATPLAERVLQWQL